MNRHYNTCVRCNGIQSGVTVSGQVYQYQVPNISVSGKLNIESQYHMSTRITMHYVLKARITLIRHVTMIKRHSHINISCNKS